MELRPTSPNSAVPATEPDSQALRDLHAVIVNSLVDHVAVTDDQGRILTVNAAWQQFASRNGGEHLCDQFVGMSYLDVCERARSDPGAPEAGLAADGLRAVLSKQRPIYRLDYPCHAPHEQRWFHLCITPLIGQPPGALITHSNISERWLVQAERERAAAMEQQLQKSESLGRMAGAIAHRFNNQLQVIMGSIDLAISEVPETSRALLGLTEAMESVRKAAAMSNQMLTYLGQHHDVEEPLDLAAVVNQTLSSVQAYVPASVVVRTELPLPGPTVVANSLHVQQVLTHLLTNAWESLEPAGGTVQVSVKTVHAKDIPSSHRMPVDWQPDQDHYACLEVADPGCGIPPRVMDKIFDPFFSTKFVGRGLGLPVVLGLVRACQGAVAVTSAPGQGSVVRVFIPRLNHDEPGVAPSAPPGTLP